VTGQQKEAEMVGNRRADSAAVDVYFDYL